MQRYLLDSNILMYILNDTGEMSSEVEAIVKDFSANITEPSSILNGILQKIIVTQPIC